jgi:hypothetical protein
MRRRAEKILKFVAQADRKAMARACQAGADLRAAGCLAPRGVFFTNCVKWISANKSDILRIKVNIGVFRRRAACRCGMPIAWARCQ